jgi:hypothetical protein
MSPPVEIAPTSGSIIVIRRYCLKLAKACEERILGAK